MGHAQAEPSPPGPLGREERLQGAPASVGPCVRRNESGDGRNDQCEQGNELQASLQLFPKLAGHFVDRSSIRPGIARKTQDGRGMESDSHPTGARKAAVARPGFKDTRDTDEADRNAEPGGQPNGSSLERLDLAVGRPAAFGEDQHSLSRFEKANDRAYRLGVRLINVQGERSERADQRTEQWDPEEGLPGQIVDWSAERDRNQNGIGVGDVVGEEQERPAARDVLDALEADPKIEAGEPPHERAGEV